MMNRRLTRDLAAALPYLGAALLWFLVVLPMRADQETRLANQGRVRRDRVKSDRAVQEAQRLRGRITAALSSVCRMRPDPAALRQRTVTATSGLALSPFSLLVTGGPGGGAQVDAEGSRSAVLDLTRRLGDPAGGGFLRSITLRDKGSRWGVAAATGVFDSATEDLLPSSSCEDARGSDPSEASAEPTPVAARPRPAAAPIPSPPGLAPNPSPPPRESTPQPFSLIAFLSGEGRIRVSIRAGEEIRVLTVGDEVDGWKCVSIDRDEGAVFISPLKGRLVLSSPR